MINALKVEAFRAISNKEECLKYAQGHEDVLASYGIKKITSSNNSWIEDEGVYVFTIKDSQGCVLGGARIHIAGYLNPLPIQAAIEPIDPSIKGLIFAQGINRVGEVCALWNSKAIAGKGISYVLVRSCIAKCGIILANQLRLDRLLALCAPWTVKMFAGVGYKIYTDIGEEGTYPYPKPDLRATVMIVEDPENIQLANALDKEKIFDLRKNPVKDSLEKGPKGDFRLSYDLIIPALDI